ncbi:MAG: hypothetical protein COT74_07260 [Bdellovibrionales bacterium CG10_big_fil_rev_8_21_14_0_10_45_34]|nr:MAG: hypothetical protein COT74_07260 [Bdellovibrionales bacterium CG10_big_fil_rev_8_21_14_0_10_45_34]
MNTIVAEPLRSDRLKQSQKPARNLRCQPTKLRRKNNGQTGIEFILAFPIFAAFLLYFASWALRLLLVTWTEHHNHLALICLNSDSSKKACESWLTERIELFPFSRVVRLETTDAAKQKSIKTVIQHGGLTIQTQTRLKSPF